MWDLEIDKNTEAVPLQASLIEAKVETLMAKTEETVLKQSIEKDKIPAELQTENYKIEFGLTWVTQENAIISYANWVEKDTTVFKKVLAPGAFVRANLAWDQFFNRKAVLHLWLQKSLPSYKDLVNIRWWEEFDNNFFKKCGYILPIGDISDKNTFKEQGQSANYWLFNGSGVSIKETRMDPMAYSTSVGVSVRLTKQDDK